MADAKTTGAPEMACGSVSASALPGTSDNESAAAATADIPATESFWVLFIRRRRPEMLDADMQVPLRIAEVLTEDEDGKRHRISVGDDCNS